MKHFISLFISIFKKQPKGTNSIIENKASLPSEGETDRYAHVKDKANRLIKDFLDYKIEDQEFCHQFDAIICEINNLEVVSKDGSILMTDDIPMDFMRLGAYHYRRWRDFVALKSQVENNPNILRNEEEKERYKSILEMGIDEEFREKCNIYLDHSKK